MAALRLSPPRSFHEGQADRLSERSRLGLRKDLRLRRRADFDLVYERGRIFNDPLLVLRVVRNELPHDRYGFVVSKRVGGAVVRNRVRRRLQEIVRLASPQTDKPANLQTGYDLLLSCKAAAATAKYAELEAAVRRLFVKGGLSQEEAGS